MNTTPGEGAELAGRVALVTGASRGIGQAAARALAAGGAAVFLSGAEPAEVATEVDRINAAGGTAAGLAVNLGDRDQLDRLVPAAEETYGGLDILVNAAGIQRYGTVVDTTDEVWDEVFTVNVKAMFQLCRQAVPAMRRRGGGAIVNVSSVQGFATQTQVVAYTASKSAILGMTRAIAVDHAAEGIRVNAVCPGSVDTPMLRSAAADFAAPGQDPAEVVADWGRGHPIGRVAQASEVGEAIRFLAGPRASFVTGSELKVDGGLLAALSAKLPD